MLIVRAARLEDSDSIWRILEPVVSAGDVYTLPRDMSRRDALAYWFSAAHQVFVAEENDSILGSYYLRANQPGGGSHVANCGYLTAEAARGRGVASAMCEHSLNHARLSGFRAMQFNFVVRTNDRAVRLWQRFGFAIIGTLPKAFLHPQSGYVDAFVMYREL